MPSTSIVDCDVLPAGLYRRTATHLEACRPGQNLSSGLLHPTVHMGHGDGAQAPDACRLNI